MAIVDRVRELVTPIVEAESVKLYDVEHNGAVLRVLVDADGGIGIDEIKRISRALSRRLDEADPMPGRYTLEVSSPGLERPLRTPDHFRHAVEDVKIKTVPTSDGARRLNGTLVSAYEDGFEMQTGQGRHRLSYEEVSKARTVFTWGPAPRPGAGPRGDSPNSSREGSPDTREVPAS